MMSVFLSVLFMIPLCYLSRGFWYHQIFYFSMGGYFLMDYSNTYMFNSITYFTGKDVVSHLMILLSVWICCLMLTASLKIKFTRVFPSLFLLVVLALFLALFTAFSAMNFLVFYIFFEMSLIPTLFLIMGWGYQPERLQAGIYLLFYTLCGSFPMMLSIFYMYKYFGSLNYYLFSYVDSSVFFLCLNFAFMVKIPMYFVHLWLPKAHVEAPISGSMILAGVMLKLGGYGLIRTLFISIPVIHSLNCVFVGVSLLGGAIISLVCLCQPDVKSLIAYSSVSHMGLVLGGLMTLSYWGLVGALVMMIAHGLCSSGLFCLSNINYERFHSRSFMLNKGLINIMPVFSLWWFLFCSSNMAAPPSLNLLGEIMLINSLITFSWITVFPLAFLSFFSAGYSLYLYSYTQHGKTFSGFYSYHLGSVREHLLLFLHWFPLNILVLSS
uniref:NADH-ubiquinone oxidoreductase chain 4 n=1 Tax=Margarinotus merdarius TaxID=878136 RepID=A0A0S2M7M3_MARMD|nr:NADH dehydrogenase subunit 4 [Margarinotus merdarius]ALO70681.1 NADH deshydrogenase subunit 4 [Margarinotus merdarius]